MDKIDFVEHGEKMGLTQEDIENCKKDNKKRDIVLYGADKITEGGFTIVPNYILRHKKITAIEKLVYSVLISYAYGNKNSCFPGQQRLSDDCCCSVKTIQRALAGLLKEECLVIVRRGQGKTNLYILSIKSVKDSRL